MRKIWDIPGGIHPPDNKVQSLQLDIGTVPLPDRFVLSLHQNNGTFANPVVAAGDKVLKGQKIAEATSYVGVCVHAPTSGTVSDIQHLPIAHPSGMTAPCIVIEPDGKEQWVERSGWPNYRDIQPEQLLQRLRETGISGLGGAGFPTAVKLSPGKPVNTLIINATECEPYITADDMLMRSRPAEIIEGIKILSYLLDNPAEILIGIEDNKSLAFDTIQEQLDSSDTGANIELVEFPTKYPSGGEKQLIQILTGQEVPNGKLPADIGIICQNIGTVHAVYRAVIHGEPLISRITTVTGNACTTKGNFEVLIGTPIAHLLECCGFDANNCERVIMGGPMMGFTLPSIDVPVIKTTNCILAPTPQEMPLAPPAQPCIRCGACAEVCPASLLPQQLFWYAQAQDHERLRAHNLFDCIECGACSYVCPSNIPLVQYYRAAKGEIRQAAVEKIKADRSRERFEYRKQRLAQLEAEKAAKREARRLAAEQARAKLAQQQDDSDENADTENKRTGKKDASDIVQAAMARAAAKKASPEQQLAKLKRTVVAAENRLQHLQQRLSDSDNLTPEKQDMIKAQAETARIKLVEAQQKLADSERSDARETQPTQPPAE